MLRDLELLSQLQEIDIRIHEQELAKEQLPATVKELDTAIGKAKAGLESAEGKTRETESELKAIEEQVQKAREGLEKSQDRLNSIKTNREYDAVHAEIEGQKNVIQSSSNKIKKLSDEIVRLKTCTETVSQDYEKIKAENEPKLTELKTKIDAIDSVITLIEKERREITSLIDKSILRTYELIRNRRKNGKVLSLVGDARTCTMCYKVLESQLINEIKRSTKLITCQNCGSIFIWTGNISQAAERH